MTATHMTENQAVNLVRNTLLAAGFEMGKEGDHWPVIKATVLSVMKDFEDWRIEQNVFDEVKQHYRDLIAEMQAICDEAPAEHKQEIQSTITELKQIYTASFSPINEDSFYVDTKALPVHIKRAEIITQTLEHDDAE